MHAGSPLRDIAGPPRLVATVEERIGAHAIVAAGLPGCGPWRLVCVRYDRIRKSVASLQIGALGQRLAVGAVRMCANDAFAKQVQALAEAEARAGTKLEAPWFLWAQEDLDALIARAAGEARVEAESYAAYAARVEEGVRRDLARF